MGKPKGSQKTGGRKKGSMNKKASLLNDALDDIQFNLISELILSINKLDDLNRTIHLMKLVEYCYPKLLPRENINSETTQTQLILNYKV